MRDEYDGPSSFDERRWRRRVERNNMLDCRDPDHDATLCPFCSDDDEPQPENEE